MIIRYKIWSKNNKGGEMDDVVSVTVETMGNDMASRELAESIAEGVKRIDLYASDGAPLKGIVLQTVDFYGEQKHNGIIDIC